ncbi:MAG: undecaprenyl/decaprenyl-phosphate alpha-N-acetylglucosaminyl 1-phosphate transferase [Pseudomonadales bacterium]|nr:undecaprenyl/decaprenyl-phosphate alpha-N-acetylglucosaminyl 1-phosphate transferase [Candidatus Woesebacteria bacterium]MCB9801764.1 undecaprenyl/decaprenyl-phosphate alpha-N-acetylglucosaminyl 1-phosphate transferase [Pseudomonadales bacterium]
MVPFFTALLVSALTAPVVIKFYRRYGWVDDPATNTHEKVLHTRSVPRGGGIVVFAGLLFACALFLQVDKYLIAILLGALILTVTGVIDDIYDISPTVRLVIGVLVALIVVGSGIGIAYISNPFGPSVIHLDQPQWELYLLGKTRTIWILSDLFALFFIVWNMNIVNWSKGVDGQMPGFVSIALIMVGILSSSFLDDPTQFHTASLAFIAAGAFSGLLLWNWHPQKMMPGYGAGSLAGYLLAVTAILSGAKVATTLMVLAIPTADALFTLLRRIIAGKSPLQGDRGHLHHLLLDIYGWSKPRIALFYWMTSLGLGLLSLTLNTTGKVVVLGSTFLIVFSFLLVSNYKSRSATKQSSLQS